MKMPGFVSEASLYNTSQVYRSRGAQVGGDLYVVLAQSPCQSACYSNLLTTQACCTAGFPVPIDLVLTDPPYGIEMSKGFSGAGGFGGAGAPIHRRQYADAWDSERPSLEVFVTVLKVCKKAIIWGGNFFCDILPRATHWIVWDKLNTMPSFGDCELAWTSIDRKSVKKITIEWNGLIGKEESRAHPTQKPVKLITSCLENYSEPKETIYDPFCGSGTTLVAAHQLDRIGYGVEIDPGYVAVTLERLAALGLKPELISEAA